MTSNGGSAPRKGASPLAPSRGTNSTSTSIRGSTNTNTSTEPNAASSAGSAAASAQQYFWSTADSMRSAVDRSYAYASDLVASTGYYGGWADAGSAMHEHAKGSTEASHPIIDKLPSHDSDSKHSRGSANLLTGPMFTGLFQNPYISIRGGRNDQAQPHDSLMAVRSLLNTVPVHSRSFDPAESDEYDVYGENGSKDSSSADSHGDNLSCTATIAAARHNQEALSSPSETASQLAEGTLRAYRDLALDEAVELHEALRYWSYRWERPMLSWLEAGPHVWFSPMGYDHHVIGQKVTQIQAVLARRCASIGDLQKHLLRSGWQRGVSAWGVLGEGGEWAAVTIFDGSMAADTPVQQTVSRPLPPGRFQRVSSELSEMRLPKLDGIPSGAPQSNVSNLPSHSGHHNALYYADIFVRNQHDGKIHIDDPALAQWSVDAIHLVRKQLRRASNGMLRLPYQEHWHDENCGNFSHDIHNKSATSTNTPTMSNPNAKVNIGTNSNPNTSQEGPSTGDGGDFGFFDSSQQLDEIERLDVAATDESMRKTPSWAALPQPSSKHGLNESMQSIPETSPDEQTRAKVTNLHLMAKEVGSLLDVMKDVIAMQRARRLDVLKQPNWMRRNWYITALGVPAFLFLCIRLSENGYGIQFIKFTASQIITFFKEHINEPVVAIFDELVKGSENISDRETRNIVVENLQLMIRSWLDENYPSMNEQERDFRAKSMDMSLIETKKAESLKTFYEINNVIRMSFIEAQFLKKEMMNALVALDDMQASNNMNMNLAAVTPAVFLIYACQRMLRFVRYALLKLGKSKEETYGSFQHGLLEMERLLVMRDNSSSYQTPMLRHDSVAGAGPAQQTRGGLRHDGIVLRSDDLGMMMLHIHELRTILWRDRRRFSSNDIRSVAEDLAELAGERGAVCVSQQIQIIARMSRTYAFLRVRNHG